ncbi:hypothetical protein PY479_11735 [Shewanella sp. A32]|uniref:hypothetical protein n=1 Tax=Shewanella sp. A32 TaxID=3031327 RepID=UPI0023B9C25E|nr:hypothetical protein [Shewanella sp. A32]MDF0534943.1 hypothetical protein [Shewanella sp. A32]
MDETTQLDEVLTVSYIGKALLEDDNRAALMTEITGSKKYKSWGVSETSTLAQMATDMNAGVVGSTAGYQTGALVAGAGLILGAIFDGSQDVSSGAWFPADYKGMHLASNTDAVNALWGLVQSKVDAIATRIGWKVTCTYGCDNGQAKGRVYYFQAQATSSLSAQYIYRPQDFTLTFYQDGFERVDVKDPINALLGQQMAWKTKGDNSFCMWLGSKPIMDGDKPAVTENKEGYPTLRWREDMVQTHLGRDILRFINDSPYTFYGNEKVYPIMVFFNGQIYSMMGNSNNHIGYKLKDTSAL